MLFSSTSSNHLWHHALALTGLCTVLLGSASPAILAQSVLIAPSTERTLETIPRELTPSSSVSEDDGSYYEPYTFAGSAGETLTFELTSNDLDAYLVLVDPSGKRIAQNDNGAEGTNALRTVTLSTTGTYTLLVKSYGAGEIGSYQPATRTATDNNQLLAQASQLNQQVYELYQAGRYAEAIPLAEQVLAITEQALGPDHSDTATSLNTLALLYKYQERYAEAEPLYQRALAIREQVLGPDHPDIALSLNNLAGLYLSQERYAEAEPLYQRALEIREQVLGSDHRLTANSLNNLAALYESQGRYSEAKPLLERALEIREQVLGPEHPDTATSLNSLAFLYESQGRYAEAKPLYQRTLTIREQVLGPDHPDTALSLNNLARLYRLQGRYAEAEPLYQRALAIAEQAFGPNHPNTATSLNDLALLYRFQGRYSEAEPLYQRALAIVEQALDSNHPNTATSLNNLATLYRLQGRYSEAEPLYQRALAINEQALGPDHPDTAKSLNNLAVFYTSQGRYAEAEPLYQRALAINEQALEPNHPDTAVSLNSLAALYASQGRYAEAEPLYQRAQSIREAALGPDHPDTATSLNNLAALYLSQGRYSEAGPLLQRALAIRERAVGPDHPDTANSLNSLAALYRLQGRYSEAEPLYQRALAINEQAVGPDHPDTANSLNNLAVLYEPQGRYSEAEPLYQRALAIRERALGLGHPDTATSLNNLAALYNAQGQFQQALTYLSQGLAVEETILSRNLVGGSDANKRDYLATVASTTDWVISLHLNDLSTDAATAQLAFSTVLQRQGRVLDLFTNLRAQLADDPDALVLLDDLNAASTQLATLTFNPPAELSTEAYLAQLKNLQGQIRDLEDQLSRRSAEFANLTASPTLANIQAALPTGTALVEFIRYRLVDLTAPAQDRFGDARYAAYILQIDGTIEGVDLGAAEAIDAAVQSLATGLASSDTPLFQVKEDAQALDSLVMAPVRQVLGETTTVFLSPDGTLNLIPFEALVDESGRYLVETYQFRYLTSGRDLMRLENTVASTNSALLVGNPTYGRPGALVAQADTRAIDFKNRIFPALPGTQAEVDLIAPQLLGAEVYTATNATEALIKQQVQPSILHIATHGFFEPDGETLNPLLQSGLILAGAAAGGQSGPDQDGILTALEVTGMNLRGTQLVVLSACETGLGELTAGEGVYGLRRALVLSGSQSQVISLWKVADTATQEWMVDYYNRLITGTPRDQALQETQQAFLNSDEYSHPYYWAAFIGSGDWRPLQLGQ